MSLRRRIVRGYLLPLGVALLASGSSVSVCGSEPFTDPPVGCTPVLSTPDSLTLEKAIELTLRHDPEICVARDKVREGGGRLRESRGLFDIALRLDTSYEQTVTALTEGERTHENGKREILRSVANYCQKVADDLRQQLQDEDRVFPDCPPGYEEILIDVDSAGVRVQMPVCIRARDRADAEMMFNLAEALLDDDQYEELQEELSGNFRDQTREMMETYDEIALRARQALRQYGTVPRFSDTRIFALDFSLSKTFRNGLTLGPGLQLESTQDVYRGCRHAASWGGKGKLDTHWSTLSLSLGYPLGKGRGTVSMAAPERAAQANYRASLESCAHTISERALATSLAYWTSLAAQEQLELQEESAGTAQHMLGIGEALLSAGAVVVGDLIQLRARAAETRAQVVFARQGLLQARLDLAGTMGLTVRRVEDGPYVKDAWPVLPDSSAVVGWNPEVLSQLSLARRSDVAASRQRESSARILAAAARADLKRQVNLTVTLSYRGLHEGGNLTSPSSMVDGWHEALSGYFPGPSIQVGLSVNWPIGNRQAQGQLAQARSLRRQSRINARNLERVTRNRIENLLGALRAGAAEVTARQRSAEDYNRLVESLVERFRAGRSSVVNVVQTEQLRISEQLALARAQQAFASLVSQLRFELGVMLEYRLDDKVVIVETRPRGYTFGS